MWDEDDHVGRWVQFFCALFLLAIAVAFGYFGRSEPSYSRTQDGLYGVATGSLILAARCLWYAFTGKDNINRDDFD